MVEEFRVRESRVTLEWQIQFCRSKKPQAWMVARRWPEEVLQMQLPDLVGTR